MKQRVALVHDNLIEFGGSERVFLEIIQEYPDADLFTFFIHPRDKKIQEVFGHLKWTTSWVRYFPWLAGLKQYFSILKPLAWYYFAHLDLSEYDLVITSCHSFNSKLVQTGKRTRHICYLYTPPRFLYGFTHELSWSTSLPIVKFFFQYLRKIDLRGAQKPHTILVSSKEIQSRVKKFYGRSSVVLHPPSSQLARMKPKRSLYYVAHSRLVKQKHIDLIVDTCSRHNLQLKVIGDGYLRNSLEKKSGKTVEFLGFVPDEKLARVYRSATALLYAAEDEDFGIVPVEAQSAGVPVIAYKSGGVKETVVDGTTGYFFDELSVESLYQSIQKLEGQPVLSRGCIAQAKKFSVTCFHQQFRHILQRSRK